MDINTTKKLNNGVEIPYLGFGTLRSKDNEETVNAVRWAIEAGYRHIDTAAGYGNEKSVGQGIRVSGIDRKKMFVTTKLKPDEDMLPGAQSKGIREKLGSSAVGLYRPVSDSLAGCRENTGSMERSGRDLQIRAGAGNRSV